MSEPKNPKIKVTDTRGAILCIAFDHWDIAGDEWIDTFKVILDFIGFSEYTISELFNEETTH